MIPPHGTLPHPYDFAMSTAADPIRVAIVNDYEVVVRGLADMLSGYAERVRVVELQVRDGVSTDVDLVLYDTYSRPREDPRGVQELNEDEHVDAVAVYTWNFEPELIDGALAAGARGYLAKTLPAKELVESLLHHSLPDAKLVEFPELGHAPQMQDPQAFHKALLDGLAALPAGR